MGRKYVYLIANDFSGTQTHTYIGASSNPLRRLREQNRLPGYSGGAKTTRAGAPRWFLVMVIGPFASGATRFKALWRARARIFERRVAVGYHLYKRLARRSRSLYVYAVRPSFVMQCVARYRL
jgi:hypothetical protein